MKRKFVFVVIGGIAFLTVIASACAQILYVRPVGAGAPSPRRPQCEDDRKRREALSLPAIWCGLLRFSPGFVEIHEALTSASCPGTVGRLRFLQAFVAGDEERFGFWKS